MRNVVRSLLAVAVVAVSVDVSSAQTWRDAGSKITGNYNGPYATQGRTYRSYSYAAPTQARTAVTNAPAVVNTPVVVNNAPKATVAPTPALATAPAVVAAPPVRVQARAQAPVRTYRTYSYQPSNQGGLPAYYYNGGYRSSQVNGYNPAFRRADAKIFGR